MNEELESRGWLNQWQSVFAKDKSGIFESVVSNIAHEQCFVGNILWIFDQRVGCKKKKKMADVGIP